MFAQDLSRCLGRLCSITPDHLEESGSDPGHAIALRRIRPRFKRLLRMM
jgi:hypothetical protein